jgi:hypothetical protein
MRATMAKAFETTADEGAHTSRHAKQVQTRFDRLSFTQHDRLRSLYDLATNVDALYAGVCAAAPRPYQCTRTPRARQATMGGRQSGIPQRDQRAARQARATSWRCDCGGCDRAHLEGKYSRYASQT